MRKLPFALLGVLATLPVPHAIGSEYAWQRADQYVPPDFEGFFPDNAVGGKLLDDMRTGKMKRVPVFEYPEVLRQGLRRATKYRSQILSQFGNQFIWRRPSEGEPQDAFAMEIMYHAAGSEYFRRDALYYGLQVAKNKTDNILHALMQFGYEDRRRTIWGVKKYDNVEHVASRLLALLDQHEQLPSKTVLTTYDVYQGIAGKDPPRPERFRDLGQFVMVVEDSEAALDGSQSLEALRTPFDQEMQLGDRLVDFTRRIHRGKVHLVALVRGAPARDRLTEQLKEQDRYDLFSTQLLRPVSIRRLPELQRHLANGKVIEPPSWKAQVALALQDFDWNRADTYVPPAFNQFFPDDAEGGQALDRLYAEREESQLSDQEILAIMRQGLRRTTVRPNSLLGWFYPRFTRWPQNPAAMEIGYHALSADTRPEGNDSILYGTLYYGFAPKSEKPKNVLRALHGVYLKVNVNQSKKQQVLGLLKTNHDKQFVTELMLETLEQHAQLPVSQVVAAYDGYQQLAGKTPPESQRFAQIGRFMLIFGFEEETSSDQAMQLIRDLYRPGKNLLEIVPWANKEDPGKHSVIALIQGIAERDRLFERLRTQDEDRFELYAAELLTVEWADKMAEVGLPEFRDYFVTRPLAPSATTDTR